MESIKGFYIMYKLLVLKLGEKYTLEVSEFKNKYEWTISPRPTKYTGTLSAILSVIESMVNVHDIEIVNGTTLFVNRVEALMIQKEDME